MNVHALTPLELAQACGLASRLFPWEVEHQTALAAALAPAEHTSFLAERELRRVRAWAEGDGTRVDGLVTFYEYWEPGDELWLAWFGLAPGARGKGQGAALLDWAIGVARSEGRTALRLWTTIEEEYAPALKLYASRGFFPELLPPAEGEAWQTVVLSLPLGKSCDPWAVRYAGRDLCGRMVPVAA